MGMLKGNKTKRIPQRGGSDMMETRKSFCRFCHVFCGIEVDVENDRGTENHREAR